MFRNDIKSALRLMKKQKSYTLIGIFSLVAGMTCFILLMLYSRYELGYDSFHKNADRIYQIGQSLPNWSVNGSNRFAETSGVLGPTLAREFPEVEYAVRIYSTDSPLIYRENRVLGQGMFADADFFKMFTYPMTTGDPGTALKDPFTIVLSETLAAKLFGRDDPVGKTVLHQDGREYRVTAVMKDGPPNSVLRFDYLLSFVTMYSLRNDIDTSWSILNYGNFVRLKEGASAGDFEAKLAGIVEKYHPAGDKGRKYFLMPLRSIHLDTKICFPVSNPVDKKNLFFLMGIAVMVLVVAGVNYINLATARAAGRSKEVGVRKTFGAGRRQLIGQFLGESYLLTFCSVLASLALASLLLPAFNSLAGISLTGRVLTEGTTLIGVLGLAVVFGLFAGGYPALVLSSLRPAHAFRNASGSGEGGRRTIFRNALVVFQFFASIILLVGTFVIQKQLNYIRKADMGYEPKNVLALRLWDRESRTNIENIKRELLADPDIRAAAAANIAPIEAVENNNFKVESETGDLIELPQVANYFVDFDYFDLFGMKMAEGRAFSRSLQGEVRDEVILNEAAVRMAGLKSAVGKSLVWGNYRMRIIGVVKDIHFTSLKTKIGPLIFRYRPERAKMLFLKISGGNVRRTIASIETAIRKHAPNFVFDYAAMEDILNDLYKGEDRLADLLTGFCSIAIVLASIGLFGLFSFIIEKKRKEIGIRKILGASITTISQLLLRDMVVLIGVAGLASIPVAFIFSRKWLQGFYYHTELSAGVFVLAIAAVLAIALACVARLTLRAAKENPANSLKNL